MRAFFDTEFLDDGKTIDLISIGAVREDGEEYYAISAACDFKRAWRSEWMRENVLQFLPTLPTKSWPGKCLDIRHPDVRPRRLIAQDLLEFMGPKPEIWAYYCDYDFICLSQLYGSLIKRPEGWPMLALDLKQALMLPTPLEKPVPDPGDLHNALADARWNRDVFNWLAENHPERVGA